jgi:hypothetical protein
MEPGVEEIRRRIAHRRWFFSQAANPAKQRRHGWSRYNAGCRCGVCRVAARDRQRRTREQRRARSTAEVEALTEAAG